MKCHWTREVYWCSLVFFNEWWFSLWRPSIFGQAFRWYKTALTIAFHTESSVGDRPRKPSHCKPVACQVWHPQASIAMLSANHQFASLPKKGGHEVLQSRQSSCWPEHYRQSIKDREENVHGVDLSPFLLGQPSLGLGSHQGCNLSDQFRSSGISGPNHTQRMWISGKDQRDECHISRLRGVKPFCSSLGLSWPLRFFRTLQASPSLQLCHIGLTRTRQRHRRHSLLSRYKAWLCAGSVLPLFGAGASKQGHREEETGSSPAKPCSIRNDPEGFLFTSTIAIGEWYSMLIHLRNSG